MTSGTKAGRKRSSRPGQTSLALSEKREFKTAARFQEISIRDLEVHPTAQRLFKKHKADRILSGFDPAKFGNMFCVKHGKKFLIFDGQHRFDAAKRWLNDPLQKLPCMVYDKLTDKEASEAFVGLNDASPVHAIDRWLQSTRAGMPLGDTTYDQADKVLVECAIPVGRSNRGMRSVGSIEKIVKTKGLDGLRSIMTCITKAWGKDPGSYNEQVLRGMLHLLVRLDGAVDLDTLAQKLASSSSPARFCGESKTKSQFDRIDTARAGAKVLAATYNVNLRKNKLDTSKL